MKTSETTKQISKALLKAQKAMSSAKKDSLNPFFKSNYADLTAVLEAIKEPLNNAGITILQPHHTQVIGDTLHHFVETILLHDESSEYISSITPIICAKQNDPQAFGGAVTYARRYGLQSLVSLPAEDDDGESAMDRSSKPEKKEAPKTSGFRKPKVENKEKKPW